MKKFYLEPVKITGHKTGKIIKKDDDFNFILSLLESKPPKICDNCYVVPDFSGNKEVRR